MADDQLVSVRGADAFRDLARDLKAAGGAALVKDLRKELSTVAKTAIVPATRRRALATLPSRGGLARLVARSPQRVVARAGATSATVAVVVPGRKKGTGASQADTGVVRHPVFNRRRADGSRVFVSQNVPPGWFTDPAEQALPAVRDAVLDVIDRTARRAGFR